MLNHYEIKFYLMIIVEKFHIYIFDAFFELILIVFLTFFLILPIFIFVINYPGTGQWIGENHQKLIHKKVKKNFISNITLPIHV